MSRKNNHFQKQGRTGASYDQSAFSFFKKPIPILYQDDQCVVFDKPANLLVIPDCKETHKTLTNIVNAQYAQGGAWHLHPCHRLDKETSGVILFAKGKKAQQVLMQEFHQRRVVKKYVALVQGHLSREQGALCAKVRTRESEKRERSELGQDALTEYRVLRQELQFAVVEVDLKTGRTNQIRIHFAQIGHPLLGDRKYGIGKNFPLKFRRTALHAREIHFKNPFTDKQIRVISDMPEDIKKCLGQTPVSVPNITGGKYA